MSDPEAESKNEPQGKKSLPWLEGWRLLFIIVGGYALILFIAWWAFGLFLDWLVELISNWFWSLWKGN
jgi:hypothetical protein